MKKLFEDFCTTNGWLFDYGRADFHNLYDLESSEASSDGVEDQDGTEDVGSIIMFLDPLQFNDNLNDYGLTESRVWTGSMIISHTSNFDEENYNERFEKYIKPLISGGYELLKSSLRCESDYTLTRIQGVEIINSMDLNCDGLVVSFSIMQNINE